MFADDTNLFYEHADLKTLLSLVNQELQKIIEWCVKNENSLKGGKQNTPFSVSEVGQMIFLP